MDAGGKLIADPLQTGLIAEKSGRMVGLIVTVIVCVVAHCPDAGVNVYVLVPGVDVLTAGVDQLPEMGVALVELKGRLTGVEF